VVAAHNEAYSWRQAMRMGAAGVPGDEIVVLGDPDLLLDAGALWRCAHLAETGKAAYLPLHYVYVMLPTMRDC
jgi:hypothetical protein